MWGLVSGNFSKKPKPQGEKDAEQTQATLWTWIEGCPHLKPTSGPVGEQVTSV